MPNKVSKILCAENEEIPNFYFRSRVFNHTSWNINSIPFGLRHSTNMQVFFEVNKNIKVQFVDDIIVTGKSEK